MIHLGRAKFWFLLHNFLVIAYISPSIIVTECQKIFKVVIVVTVSISKKKCMSVYDIGKNLKEMFAFVKSDQFSEGRTRRMIP